MEIKKAPHRRRDSRDRDEEWKCGRVDAIIKYVDFEYILKEQKDEKDGFRCWAVLTSFSLSFGLFARTRRDVKNEVFYMFMSLDWRTSARTIAVLFSFSTTSLRLASPVYFSCMNFDCEMRKCPEEI